MTIDEALNMLAERTHDNKRDLDRKNLQRRNQPEDLYGVEYSRIAASNSPAIFYISVSLDMVYIERFQFKVIISPFLSSVGGNGAVTGTSATINGTSMTVSGSLITPNPHTHTSPEHSHNIVPGITSSDFPDDGAYRIAIGALTDDGESVDRWIDVTGALASHWGGVSVFRGPGVHPRLKIDYDFDILQVACDYTSAGRIADAKALLEPGYKPIRITPSDPCTITLVNYLKYSHLNR